MGDERNLDGLKVIVCLPTLYYRYDGVREDEDEQEVKTYEFSSLTRIELLVGRHRGSEGRLWSGHRRRDRRDRASAPQPLPCTRCRRHIAESPESTRSEPDIRSVLLLHQN